MRVLPGAAPGTAAQRRAGVTVEESQRRTAKHPLQELGIGQATGAEVVRAVKSERAAIIAVGAKDVLTVKRRGDCCTGNWLGIKLHEVKMIEREILLKFESVCQGEGC